MAKWLTRSLVQGPRNGTNSHTLAFTPATAGNFLVLVLEGAVTHTVPTGWTRQAQALNNTELSVYTKTATAGESSFSTTHNASNFPVIAEVLEFPAGSSWVAGVAATGLAWSAPHPVLSGLTGTNLLFAAVADDVSDAGEVLDTTWTGTPAPVENTDTLVRFDGTDGFGYSLAYVEDSEAGTFSPVATVNTNGFASKEALTFAVKVAASAAQVLEATGVLSFGLAVEGTASTVATAGGSLSLGLAVGGTASTVAAADGSLTLGLGLEASARTVGITTGLLQFGLTANAPASTTREAAGLLTFGLAIQATARSSTGAARDVEVSASLEPRSWSATLEPRRWEGRLA